MPAPPRVTVAVPVYNSAPTLERCLRSALAQTLPDIEVIVADDGSTDGSLAVAERVAAEDARVRVLRLPTNRGKPHAMNRMVAEARGAWVAVLDADDAFRPQRLARLLEAAEAHGVDMAADNLLYRDAGIDRVVATGFEPSRPPRVIGTDDLVREASSYAGFDLGVLKPMVRRSFLQAHGIAYFERTRLAEDFYYLLSYLVAGGRCVLLPEPLYEWTMPFGMVSRRWTGTAGGAWRYDYRQALVANEHYLAAMRDRGEHAVVSMLERRGRQYRVMVHYLAAQRHWAEGRRLEAAATLAAHPGTHGLLLRRIAGRMARGLAPARTRLA